MAELTVQSKAQLETLKRPELLGLVKQFKAEDTDCLQEVNGRSKNDELIEALAQYMGLTNVEAEQQAVTEEVNKEIDESSDVLAELFTEDELFQPEPTEAPVEADGGIGVVDSFESAPTVATQDDPFEQQPTEQAPVEGSADTQVDNLLAELGLADAPDIADILMTPEAPVPVAEKPKKERAPRVTIPMDAPIPVRTYQNLILGIYGNILEEREEPFPTGHKYEGLTHEELKLERFNPKAHETFRATKGNMVLMYTQAGSSYMMVLHKPDGTLDPVLEVSNKGRGHLRCKQIANALQVAYNEKADQKVIPSEVYLELSAQLEKAIKPEEAEAENTQEAESQGA